MTASLVPLKAQFTQFTDDAYGLKKKICVLQNKIIGDKRRIFVRSFFKKVVPKFLRSAAPVDDASFWFSSATAAAREDP